MPTDKTVDSHTLDQIASIGSSNPQKLDHDRHGVASSPKATARELNDALALRGLSEIRPHGLALAMAVIELNQNAGLPARWTHDDPTVALLRVAAKLCLAHPDASSTAAADLIERLAKAESHGVVGFRV